MVKILIIVVVILIALLYIFIKVIGSIGNSIFDGLSGGAFSSADKLEKKAKYQKSFLARLFHRHQWEPKLNSDLKYSQTEKICYICGSCK